MGLVIGIVVAVIVVLLIIYVIVTYNGLVRARNAYQNAFAQIDVQLQRRFDLIPNLVETAKAYMSHERETLEAVTQARAAAINGLGAAQASPGDPQAMQQLAATQGALSGALVRFTAVAEQYPDLKANQNMAQLSEGTHLHREQGRVLAPGLQRLGDDLREQARGLPRLGDRRNVQVRRGGAVDDRARRPRGARGPEVQF